MEPLHASHPHPSPKCPTCCLHVIRSCRTASPSTYLPNQKQAPRGTSVTAASWIRRHVGRRHFLFVCVCVRARLSTSLPVPFTVLRAVKLVSSLFQFLGCFFGFFFEQHGVRLGYIPPSELPRYLRTSCVKLKRRITTAPRIRYDREAERPPSWEA